MKDRETIVFITKDDNTLTAHAVKEYLLSNGVLTIIISESEFNNSLFSALKIKYVDKHKGIKNSYDFLKKQKDIFSERFLKSDYKTGSAEAKKAKNIIVRYNPDLIILNNYKLLSGFVEMRNRLAHKSKIAVVIDEFVPNPRFANLGVDKYYVQNDSVKGFMVQKNIHADNIEYFKIPLRKSSEDTLPQKTAKEKLALNEAVTITLLGGDYPGSSFVKFADLIMENYPDLNLIVGCGYDRKILKNYESRASEKVKIFNEGINVPLCFDASDIILTTPAAHVLQDALNRNKLIFIFGADGKVAIDTTEYLTIDVAVNIDKTEVLKNKIDQYINDKNSFEGILEIIYELNKEGSNTTEKFCKSLYHLMNGKIEENKMLNDSSAVAKDIAKTIKKDATANTKDIAKTVKKDIDSGSVTPKNLETSKDKLSKKAKNYNV